MKHKEENQLNEEKMEMKDKMHTENRIMTVGVAWVRTWLRRWMTGKQPREQERYYKKEEKKDEKEWD